MNRLGIALAPFVILGALAAAVGAQEKAKPALAKASVSPPFEKRGNLNMSPQHAVRDTRSPTQMNGSACSAESRLGLAVTPHCGASA